MLPILTHTFSRQLTQQEKERVFENIRWIILEKTSARFIRTPDTLQCKIPFFVSKGNPYRIFDTLEFTFTNNLSGSTIFQCETFHTKAILANIWMMIILSLLLLYVTPWEEAVWEVSLYIFIMIVYTTGLLWAAHKRSKKIFETSIQVLSVM